MRVVVLGVDQRRRPCGSSSKPAPPGAAGRAGARARREQRTARSRKARSALHTLHHLAGALLEVGLQRDRVGGVERHLVDELARVEPRHEDHAARQLVAAARLDAAAHRAAARDDLDLVAAAHAERLGVLGVQVDHGVGEREVQLGHAARHRARVPVLEHAAGDQPQRVFLVGLLGRRLVGQRVDVGLVVRVAVELEAGAGLHVGIGALLEAPACVSLPFTTGQRRPRTLW